MTEKDFIESSMYDTLLERPQEIQVGEHIYSIYYATLGKSILVKQILEEIGISRENNIFDEVYTKVVENKTPFLRIIVLYTFNKKEQHFCSSLISKRLKFFEENLSDTEIASLFLTMMSYDNIEPFLEQSGINAETEAKIKASETKKGGNSLSFGGKTLYGTMIDVACAKYGWTYEYCVWGVALSNLKLLALDSVTTLYMSDEEMKAYKSKGGNIQANGGDSFGDFISKLKAIGGRRR